MDIDAVEGINSRRKIKEIQEIQGKGGSAISCGVFKAQVSGMSSVFRGGMAEIHLFLFLANIISSSHDMGKSSMQVYRSFLAPPRHCWLYKPAGGWLAHNVVGLGVENKSDVIANISSRFGLAWPGLVPEKWHGCIQVLSFHSAILMVGHGPTTS